MASNAEERADVAISSLRSKQQRKSEYQSKPMHLRKAKQPHQQFQTVQVHIVAQEATMPQKRKAPEPEFKIEKGLDTNFEVAASSEALGSASCGNWWDLNTYDFARATQVNEEFDRGIRTMRMPLEQAMAPYARFDKLDQEFEQEKARLRLLIAQLQLQLQAEEAEERSRIQQPNAE